MKALEQPGDPESPSQYSTLWMELIDRGGLYHISDDVFSLIESIEMVVRHYLNISSIQAEYHKSTDLIGAVCEHVLNSYDIMECWEIIAGDIPSKFEKYSIELLSVITEL